MGIGCDAVRIWTAFGVGARLAGGCLPRSRGCHRLPRPAKALPPTAKGLPLSAKTCHDLPRAASSLSHPWRSTGPLQNSVWKECVAIILMGLKLWHIDVARRTGMRSGASHLLLENEGEGHPSPVTVCHINLEGWSRGSLARVPRPRTTSAAWSKTVRPRRTGLNGRRPGPNREASRLFSTTFWRQTRGFRRQMGENDQQVGDIWRQQATDFGSSKEAGGGCYAGPGMISVAMRPVGKRRFRVTYDDQRSGGGSRHACLHADGIGAAGAGKPLEPRQKTTNATELQNPASKWRLRAGADQPAHGFRLQGTA